MSARLNLGIGIGTLAVMLIMSFGNLYFTNQAKIQSEKTEDIMNRFIDKWENRININNKITNSTQDKIENAIVKILNNLTSHRVITNQTFDHIEQLLNKTNSLTGPEYEKLADKRVHNIIGNLSEEHEIIFKALNITKTETPNEEKQLGQLLKDFLQGHKEKINEPQRPKVK